MINGGESRALHGVCTGESESSYFLSIVSVRKFLVGNSNETFPVVFLVLISFLFKNYRILGSTSKMHDTPTKLQEICVDSLCESVWAMCTTSSVDQPEMSNSQISALPDMIEIDAPPEPTAIRLPCVVSDEVLRRMSEKNRLNDDTLRFFDSNRTTLRHVRLVANRNLFSADALEILADHDLETVALQNFKENLDIGFDRFVDRCLNDWTKSNLTMLDVRGTFAFTLVDRIDRISILSNLRALTVADTPFDDNCLQRVCHDLLHLEYLDISHTKVKDLGPLRLTKDRLRVLSIHRPRLRSANEALDVLMELHKLEVIDISDFPKTSIPVNVDQQRGRLGVSLVTRASERCVWRSLRILDMSGDQANFDTNEFR